jgi:hypothetical protein
MVLWEAKGTECISDVSFCPQGQKSELLVAGVVRRKMTLFSTEGLELAECGVLEMRLLEGRSWLEDGVSRRCQYVRMWQGSE